MGLDMYLYKRYLVGPEYTLEGEELVQRKKPIIKVELVGDRVVEIDSSNIYEIREEVGYWSGAYTINNWFNENIEDYDSKYREQLVSLKVLKKLLSDCEKAVALEYKKAIEIIPHLTKYFFLEEKDFENNYFDELKYTIEILKKLNLDKLEEKDLDYSFRYEASY